MFERQRKKADERVRAALASRLGPQEAIRISVLATTRLRILAFVVSGSLITRIAEAAGLTWASFAVPLLSFVFFGLTVRTHYVVLTDRRLLVLRCRPASSKVVSDEWEARRGPGTPSYRPGAFAAFVRLDLDKGPITLQVQWVFADRARALVKEATSGAETRSG